MKGDRYLDWLASLTGACLIAVALGLLFPVLRPAAPYHLIAGALLHGWGMYRICRLGQADGPLTS